MEELLDAPPTDPAAATIRRAPPPPTGGLLTLLRFMRANHMLRMPYLRLLVRLAWLRLRFGPRIKIDGIAFVCPHVKLEIAPGARLVLGRWCWLGQGCKIRVHEGEVSIGAKSVLGQECTISAYQHISIGRECIVADRVMMIDFDHGVVDVERPIRAQGIYKRDVNIGHNVWVGYAAAVLRGVTVGDNSVVGTNSVVTRDVPTNAVVGGVPARVLRMRDAPQQMRFE